MDRQSRFQYAALAAIALGYVAHFRLLEARLQDDAFISFRYARNLAEGAGLVWNIGERVEGYTNFLWTVLLSVPLLLSEAASPIRVARALSSGAGYAALIATFLLVRQMAPSARLLPLVAPALLAGSWAFAINTMTGLETVFFGALVTIFTLLLVYEQDDLRYRGSSIVCAFAALTRPEAIGLFLIVFGVVAVGHRKGGPEAHRYLVRLALPFVAIAGTHEIFRLAYYGELAPNTFFAKFGVELPPGMPTRRAYLADFLTKGMDPLGLSAALAALFVVVKAREPKARIIAVGSLFGFANVALGGADFMIGFRYLVPYLPLLHVSATLGGAYLMERIASKTRARKLEVGISILTVIACYYGFTYSRDRLRPFEELRRRVMADTNEALGQWMAQNLPPGTVVVARDIGEIGYLSKLPVIDMTGLTDRAIARKPGNLLDRALDLDDVFGRDPGAFVFITKLPGPMNGPGRFVGYSSPSSTRAMLTDPRMEEGYVFFARYPSYERLVAASDGSWQPVAHGAESAGDTRNSYFLELYLRKDLAAALRH